MVVQQSDILGNVVGPISQGDVVTLGYNPCTITDWLCFKDNTHVSVDGRFICFDNKFRLGCFNIDVVDYTINPQPTTIRYNSLQRLKNISIYPAGYVFIESNYNCDIYDLELVGGIYSNTNLNINTCSTLLFNSLNVIDVRGGALINFGIVRNVELTGVSSSEVFAVIDNIIDGGFYIDNGIKVNILNCLSTLSLSLINCQNLSLQNNTYTTVADFINVASRIGELSLTINPIILQDICFEVDGTITGHTGSESDDDSRDWSYKT